MPVIKSKVIRVRNPETGEWNDLPGVVSLESFRAAERAEAWATGGTGGEASETNNAQYWSGQSAAYSSQSGLYKDGAETARDRAAQWATGGTTGDPSATNNAKYYAEQAEAWAAGTSGGTPSATNNAAYYASQAGSSATAAAGDASDAEAFGAGTRGGTDVESDDPAYHNNAAYYAEQAGDAASSVSSSAAQIAANAADIADLKDETLTFKDWSGTSSFTIDQMPENSYTRVAASKLTGCPAEIDGTWYIYVVRRNANAAGNVSVVTIESAQKNQVFKYVGNIIVGVSSTDFSGWVRLADENDIGALQTALTAAEGDIDDLQTETLTFKDWAGTSTFGTADMPRNSFTRVKASKLTDGPSDIGADTYIYIARRDANSAGNVSVVTIETTSGSRNDKYIGFIIGSGTTGGDLTGWKKLADASDVAALQSAMSAAEGDIDHLEGAVPSLIAADATAIGNGDNLNGTDYRVPGTYAAASQEIAGSLSNCPIGAAFRMIVLQTTASGRVFQIIFPNSSNSSVTSNKNVKMFIRNLYNTPDEWSEWQAVASRAYVDTVAGAVQTAVNALDGKVDALEAKYTKRTYNLLDADNLTLVDSYISISGTTYTLKHQGNNAVKALAVPVTEGKTYTFSRKNKGSRLAIGCGSALWTDDEDHALLNALNRDSDGTTATITVPTGGTYLYVYFYRAASDADYNATLEEAEVVEGIEALPYVPYRVLDVTEPALSEPIRQDIQKGVTAYRLDRWMTRSMIFGVEFDLSGDDPAGVRIGNAEGLEQSDFDHVFPWCDMKRCCVSIDNGQKTVVYEGDNGFAADGSAGNVFVEVPAFYVCREQTDGKERWLISGTKKSGFELHPWFDNGDGSTAEFRYYGAYKACSAGNGIFSASGYLPYSNAGQQAGEEAFPVLLQDTGFGRNNVYALSAVQYLFVIEYATRNGQSVFNGSTYNPYKSTATFEQIKDITENGHKLKLSTGSQTFGNSLEFYSVGMQVYIGTTTSNGIVRNVTDFSMTNSNIYITVDGDAITLVRDGNNTITGGTTTQDDVTVTWTSRPLCMGCAQATGKTDALTTPSGYAPGQDTHVAAFRYRYIENPWGTIWETLDGLRLKDGSYYIAEPEHFRDADISEWTALSYAAPMITADDAAGNNWIQTMGYDTNNRVIALPTVPLYTDAGETGTITTDSGTVVRENVTIRGKKYWCDAFYSKASGTTDELIPFIGGGWDHHENAGPFCARFLKAGAEGTWLYGERITC